MQLSAADDPDDDDDEEGNENERLGSTGGNKDNDYFPTVRELLGLPPTPPPPSSSSTSSFSATPLNSTVALLRSNAMPTPQNSSVKPAAISTPVQSLVYTKPVVKAAKAFTSDLRLHELIRFKDENTGLMKLIVYLRIVDDTLFDTAISSDGKTLTYYIQPAETNPQSFLPAGHDSLKDQATNAIISYFTNDPGTEVFKYVVTLPEAVDSNCQEHGEIFRSVMGFEAGTSKKVWVKQKVWETHTYVISGQQVGGMRGAWIKQ
ncbi:hypothetical protein BDR26DRAFT_875685 [Obelidium mucronatum]|nr:hypothetical protein BDR26DRAFT_875685 [Obelidium mucronatum]